MLLNQPSRRRAFVQAVTGLGLAMLMVVPATLANAAPRVGTTTTPSVKSMSAGPSCTPYTGNDLAGFIAAAETSYPATECLSSSGEALTSVNPGTISSPAILGFQGATVTGTSALSGPMLSVATTSANTTIMDVTLNGGGGEGDGIACHAACRITSSTVEGMMGNGIYISSAPGSVIGGSTAASEVSTVGNTKAGLEILNTASVTVGYFASSYNNHYGVEYSGDAGPCATTSIIATDTGIASAQWGLATNNNGSAVELLGTGTAAGNGCSFQNVTATTQGGYGLALSGSSYNSFAHVSVTGEPKGQINPAINFSGGSASNTFNSAKVNHESMAVDIGNDGVKGGKGEVGNDDNVFTSLSATDDTYGTISVVGGSGNVFTSVTGTGEGSDGKYDLGLIQFRTNPATKNPDTSNVVKSANFTGAPMAKWDTAKYVLYTDAGTSGNSATLASVDKITYSQAACSTHTGNTFTGC